ncbi:hypothetical protein ACQP04_29590 [Pseudonocardia halophobica]
MGAVRALRSQVGEDPGEVGGVTELEGAFATELADEGPGALGAAPR